MSAKTFNTRVVHKHDTEAGWSALQDFIPMQGEIIIYDTDETHEYERVKIGDGTTEVNTLPFLTSGGSGDTSGLEVYVGADEPTDESIVLWVDTDEEGSSISVDTTLSIAGEAADAKAVGDAIAEVSASAASAQETADSKAPAYTYGTDDLTAGTSELATGTLYFVYE